MADASRRKRSNPSGHTVGRKIPLPEVASSAVAGMYVAKASLPAGHMLPRAVEIDAVARLRVDLSVSTLVECINALGLGLCVGSVGG